MKIYRHTRHAHRAYSTVRASANFIRHLRRYLHLEDDARLVLYGGMSLLAQGYGWYKVYAYNPQEKGSDLEFALKQLTLCEKWMHKKMSDEIRLLIGYGVGGLDRTDYDAQMRAKRAMQADLGLQNDVRRLHLVKSAEERARAVPAKPKELATLASKLNHKFHRA